MRRRVFFYGRVQGVGFRYTTVSIARRYPVVGYVRNLPNGSVEMVAEAKPSVLDQFVADIVSEFAGYIRRQEVHDVDRDEVFVNFETRR
ncbi:MAG: acylphosphatase [Planctomycetaceae bacterium]|nr:acylphosphatase [Planctomycetaceae bacterium]